MTNSFKDFINSISDLIGNTISGLLLTLAVAAFFWVVVKFIFNRSKGNATGLEDAKNQLLWGVIGIFVMFSIWGIVTFLQTGLGFTQNTIQAPTITTGAASAAASGVSLCSSFSSQSVCAGNSACSWNSGTATCATK
jgi:hypothetical protein